MQLSKHQLEILKKANDSLIQTHHWNVKWNDYGLFILRCDKCSTELTVCSMDMSFTSVDNIVVILGPFKYCLSWIMCSCGEAVMKKALST